MVFTEMIFLFKRYFYRGIIKDLGFYVFYYAYAMQEDFKRSLKVMISGKSA